MDYFYLLLGFVILLVSGDLLVKGGVAMASKFKIPTMLVGITVVSFGTSAPELFVSLDAALSGSPDIALGNVIGSNISNIALVLGFTAILLPIPIKGKAILSDWIAMLLASITLYLFCLDKQIVWWEGLCLFSLLIVFIVRTIILSKKNKLNADDVEETKYSLLVSLLMILIAALGLYFGANMLVGSAKLIAREFGLSERVIGLTIVAFGTSVPELATSAVAAFKRQMDISIGNIIGSNIFNILGVLGLTSFIKTINVSDSILKVDFLWMIGVSILLFIIILPLKKSIIYRWKGLILLSVYITYVVSIFI